MTVNPLKKIISRYSEAVDTDSDEHVKAIVAPARTNISADQQKKIDIESLRDLIPIRNLSEEELIAFSIGSYAEIHKSSETLFVEGNVVDSVLYLLSGTVMLESKSGRGHTISAGTAQSRFPMSSGEIHTTTATTTTAVTILRVSNAMMSVSQESIDSEIMGEEVETIIVPPELEDSQLFQAIYQNYTQEGLMLSILPPVANLIMRAMSGSINKRQAARIIESDAVIAAKVISVANSPLFLGTGAVCSVIEAVNQLGLKATQNLVKGICKRYFLNSSNRPYVERIQRASVDSLILSGLSFAIANLTEAVDPKLALTAGLISNIGMAPFAHYVDKFPSQLYTEDEIDLGWPMVRGFMGSFVLKKLGFTEQLSQIPIISENWSYDSGNKLGLEDIVIISHLHMRKRIKLTDDLPALKDIPAIQKLGGKGYTPELSRMLDQLAMKRVRKPLAVAKQPLSLAKEVAARQSDSDIVTS